MAPEKHLFVGRAGGCAASSPHNKRIARDCVPRAPNFALALKYHQTHLQSRPTHGTIACVGYDSVAQWIRALPCGGRGRAFESPQGHHRSEGRSRNLASGRPSERPTVWGGDRAVECARLENELGVKAYVGSNPTLPATRLKSVIRCCCVEILLHCRNNSSTSRHGNSSTLRNLRITIADAAVPDHGLWSGTAGFGLTSDLVVYHCRFFQRSRTRPQTFCVMMRGSSPFAAPSSSSMIGMSCVVINRHSACVHSAAISRGCASVARHSHTGWRADLSHAARGFVHNRADFQHLYHGAYSGRPLGR